MVSENGFRGWNEDKGLMKVCSGGEVGRGWVVVGIERGKNVIGGLMMFGRGKEKEVIRLMNEVVWEVGIVVVWGGFWGRKVGRGGKGNDGRL